MHPALRKTMEENAAKRRDREAQRQAHNEKVAADARKKLPPTKRGA